MQKLHFSTTIRRGSIFMKNNHSIMAKNEFLKGMIVHVPIQLPYEIVNRDYKINRV